NRGAGSFTPLRLRAGTGLNGVETTAQGLAVLSPEETVTLVLGDFNHDGRTDLLAGDLGSQSLTFLAAQGAGGFADPQNNHSFFLGGSPPDLAALNLNGSTPGTLFRNRNLNGSRPLAIQVSDFTGDGNLDVAVLDDSTHTVQVLLGDGTGTFHLA